MASIRTSLRHQQHELICQLSDAIECTWKEHLSLTTYHIPADLGYIEDQLEGEKLTIENHCYQASHFRKLHLELARVGNGLDILHCVMFPRPEYPLPIFGCDIIGLKGQISAAIVDLSPITTDRTLPVTYQLALSQLPETQFEQPRQLPEWGDIFSTFCTFVRPISQLENQYFIQRVQNLLELHCNISNKVSPVKSKKEQELIIDGQRYYCQQQLKNDKTRRILEKSFGKDWTDYYMINMLFDANMI